MSFDDITLWLVTAMSLTAIVFLFWTLAAVVRTSRSGQFSLTPRHSRPLVGLTASDQDTA